MIIPKNAVVIARGTDRSPLPRAAAQAAQPFFPNSRITSIAILAEPEVIQSKNPGRVCYGIVNFGPATRGNRSTGRATVLLRQEALNTPFAADQVAVEALRDLLTPGQAREAAWQLFTLPSMSGFPASEDNLKAVQAALLGLFGPGVPQATPAPDAAPGATQAPSSASSKPRAKKGS